MSHPVTVTDTTFKEEVLDSDLPVLVDFWASWCTPCKMIAPIVEEFATQYEGQVKVAKVDVDANPITPGMFGIMSIPTLMIFKGGKAEERIVGYQPKQSLEPSSRRSSPPSEPLRRRVGRAPRRRGRATRRPQPPRRAPHCGGRDPGRCSHRRRPRRVDRRAGRGRPAESPVPPRER